MTDQNWWQAASQHLSQEQHQQAQKHQDQLTKPQGSLGQIEQLAIQLSAMQNTSQPQVDNINISIFAADHGIATQGVSAFPQAVTVEMIRNFVKGGAAISVLARHHQADLNVVNCGTALPLDFSPDELAQVQNFAIAAGTEDLSSQAAMSLPQAEQALAIGRDMVDSSQQKNRLDVFVAGEMGIGNTTTASALSCALLKLNGEKLAGRGTGIDDQILEKKISLIDQALNRASVKNTQQDDNILALAAEVGGFEILAIAGAYIRCAQLAIPVLVDGFITTAAALLAVKLAPECRQWMLFAHQSKEQGHQLLLNELQAEPLLDLSLRLGEGSGAALAIPLLQQACALHQQMATFAQAEVSSAD